MTNSEIQKLIDNRFIFCYKNNKKQVTTQVNFAIRDEDFSDSPDGIAFIYAIEPTPDFDLIMDYYTKDFLTLQICFVNVIHSGRIYCYSLDRNSQKYVQTYYQ